MVPLAPALAVYLVTTMIPSTRSASPSALAVRPVPPTPSAPIAMLATSCLLALA